MYSFRNIHNVESKHLSDTQLINWLWRVGIDKDIELKHLEVTTDFPQHGSTQSQKFDIVIIFKMDCAVKLFSYFCYSDK